MTFIDKIFGKKKKKSQILCRITKSPIDKGFGYVLSTAQVISSKKYWDMIMTEPETLSYTISHFKSEETGTRIRSMIFEKYSSIESPWIISDDCINLFEEVASLDKDEAKKYALDYWENDGKLSDSFKTAEEDLEPDTYQAYRDYAILEAGRQRILQRAK